MHDVLGTLHASQAEPGKSESGSSELLQSLPQVSRGRIFWSCVQVTAHCWNAFQAASHQCLTPIYRWMQHWARTAADLPYMVQISSGLAGTGLVLRQFGALPASDVLGTHTSATEALLAGETCLRT